VARNSEEKWRLVAFVLSSKYRTEVLKRLKNSPTTPSKLSKELNCPLSRISEALRDLEKAKLVTCIAPKMSKGRLYKLTKKGEEILKMVLSENETRKNDFNAARKVAGTREG
jgi:predicted transcriptional regulator